MEKKDFDLNRKIMFEVGLDQAEHRRLIDQDYGTEYKAQDGRYYVGPNSQSGVHSVEFNPALNSKQAESLFQYFGNKMADVEGSPAISTYYSQDVDKEKGTGYVEAVTEDNQRIRSDAYINESLRYIDIIMKMNGSTHVDLHEYDDKSKEELDEIRREQRREDKMIQRSGYSGRMRDKAEKPYDPTKEKDVL